MHSSIGVCVRSVLGLCGLYCIQTTYASVVFIICIVLTRLACFLPPIPECCLVVSRRHLEAKAGLNRISHIFRNRVEDKCSFSLGLFVLFPAGVSPSGVPQAFVQPHIHFPPPLVPSQPS